MSKILVTGGAGFIGSHLVDELIRMGNDVVVIDDLSTGLEEYINPKATFYETNISYARLSSIFRREKFDFVFHLAAQIDVRLSVVNPQYDNEINLLGGLNVLENCSKYQVKKIIFASSSAIYGDVTEIPTNEHCLPEPRSPYGIHKLTFEKYLNFYHKVYGQKYVALRPANVYGERQFKGGEGGVVSVFIDNAVRNQESKLNGDGTQTRDFVYVGDLVRAFVKALETEYIGVVNIGTGIETDLLQVIGVIGEALGRHVKIKKMPAIPGEQRRSCLNIERAAKVLGWKPKVDLKAGIKKTIEM